MDKKVYYYVLKMMAEYIFNYLFNNLIIFAFDVYEY